MALQDREAGTSESARIADHERQRVKRRDLAALRGAAQVQKAEPQTIAGAPAANVRPRPSRGEAVSRRRTKQSAHDGHAGGNGTTGSAPQPKSAPQPRPPQGRPRRRGRACPIILLMPAAWPSRPRRLRQNHRRSRRDSAVRAPAPLLRA